MPSLLFPERPLLISPTLAATIGLEEAVMLHVLDELMQRRPPSESGARQWLDVGQGELAEAMPFWDTADIARIQRNLLEKGLIDVDEAGSKAGNVRIALGNSAGPNLQAAAKAPVLAGTGKQTAASPRPNAGGKATQIPPDWYPNNDLYQLCAKRNIPRTFVDEHVRLFVISQQERKKTQYSWHNTFYKYIVREWESSRSHQGLKELEANMSADWQPNEDAFSILEHAGINHAFIEDAVPEFVLYWRETGLKTSTWNTKFIAHVRRQWAKYEAALEHDTAPKLIAEDYQPGDEVYDVLELANIDLKFAQELIPEFVLYWRERKEVSASWHTKFLQHVKFKWAHRQEDKEDFIERVTDRSWAN